MNKLKSYSFIFSIILCLISSSALSLEIDEKLTMRILQASGSKKTVLLNRGLEDGLVVGDHAKFFITTGVIARGVVVKASPTRSIWSIYRLVKPAELNKGVVANIKISSPVRLTADSSKSIRALSVPAGSMGEPNDVFPGKAMNLNEVETSEVKSLLEDDSNVAIVEASSNSSRAKGHSLELSALLSMSSLSGTYTDTDANGSFDAKNSSMNISGAIEKYFPTSQSFLKNFSLKLMAARSSQDSGNGINNIVTLTDLGGGLAYYFGKGPHMSNSLMFFGEVNFGISTGVLEIQDNINTTNNTSNSLEGAGSFMSFGLGAKYLVGNKFGGIAKLDYYNNKTTYDIDENGTINTDELAYSGPRVQFGLFYRFF